MTREGYHKVKREVLDELIWSWIKAPDVETLKVSRAKLLERLREPEVEYITHFYEPKEPSFCRAYTRLYRNLRVHAS